MGEDGGAQQAVCCLLAAVAEGGFPPGAPAKRGSEEHHAHVPLESIYPPTHALPRPLLIPAPPPSLRTPPPPHTHTTQIPADKTAADLYAALNVIKVPSMIRVEADECTYPLHIIIR